MIENFTPRWEQRFSNFQKAFLLLQDIVEQKDDLLQFEPIVQEGIIQRFEYSFELAWKTLKDKMEFDGILFEKIAPKYIFKEAFKNKYIDKIDCWLEMTNDRNLMNHTYDFSNLAKVLSKIKQIYYPQMLTLYRLLKSDIKTLKS